MFEKVSPESIGVKSEAVQSFIELLNKRGARMHSVILARHGKIFGEFYWKPFNKDFNHRMYSETKSFVAIAIGLLEEEGKLERSDKIVKFFPEETKNGVPRFLDEVTVEDLLMMRTSGMTPGSYDTGEFDRVKLYFNHKHHTRPSRTLWEYDSNGSHILSCIVEKLTGMALLDYLKEKLFNKMGTFQTATILKTKGGHSWGDSAMVCTSRDMLSFGQLVMQYGEWEGERLMNEAYLKKATSKLSDNHYNHNDYAFTHGYGYQIWKTEQDGFAFLGMGDELTICLPSKDFICVCTADNQGTDNAYRNLFTWELFDTIIDPMLDDALPENEKAQSALNALSSSLELRAVKGMPDSPFRAEIDNKEYLCEENPMGITKLSFHFAPDGTKGEFHYTNPQGDKVIPFGVNYNVFGKFPQTGYINDVCFEPTTDGFMMDDAVSLAWFDEKKIMLSIQIIDRYMGNMSMSFNFRDDYVAVYVYKAAEYFLHDYCEPMNIELTVADARFIAKKN